MDVSDDEYADVPPKSRMPLNQHKSLDRVTFSEQNVRFKQLRGLKYDVAYYSWHKSEEALKDKDNKLKDSDTWIGNSGEDVFKQEVQGSRFPKTNKAKRKNYGDVEMDLCHEIEVTE